MKFSTAITLTDATGKSWTFDTVESLEIFIKKEIDFWVPLLGLATTNSTANSFIQKHINFQIVLNQLTDWTPQFELWDSNTTYTNVVNLLIQQLGTSWICTNNPLVSKWLELNQISGSNTADAFFEAMVQKTTSRFANGIDFFQGYLIAYEYINQDKTDINKRRDSEKKSLSTLRDRLVEKHNQIILDVDNFQKELMAWKAKTELEYSDWFEKQVINLDQAVLSHSKNFYEQLSNWTEKQKNLENLYQEKLRLEPSAQYWDKSAIKLNTQGNSWAKALVLSVLLGFVTFAIFFIFWLKGEKTILSLQNIEGVLLFATIISCYAFLLKSISKAMFSAFHLQRVSEESALLTSLYLSLIEGKDDDPESRKIVLQALFSRSETGLLSGEHGPTMPTATEFINIVGRTK